MKLLCIGTLAMVACSVIAAPKIRIMPYDQARFIEGQMFDVRVEFTPSAAGRTILQPKLEIGGKDYPVKLDKANGFTIRAFSVAKAGPVNIQASASESGDETAASKSAKIVIESAGGRKRRIKNIIICLGDGMGIAHRTAARVVRFGHTNGIPNGWLNMDQMPGYGAVTTSSLVSMVTDSAPGMTGYVSGSHNDNGSEGVYPDNTPTDAFDNPRIEYLSQFLHRKFGTALGIVTTADVEDATPASQMVHTYDRGKGTGIVNQFFAERNRSGLQVLMGGGRRWFLPQGEFGSSRSSSSNYQYPPDVLNSGWNPGGNTIDTSSMAESIDLIKKFEGQGFKYAGTNTELKSIPADATKLLGLFGFGNMNTSLDKIAKRRTPNKLGVVDDYFAPDQPMLDEMATAAIKVLDNNNKANGNKGFNLLIEGAHIDKMSHAMDADRAIWETLEFDRAVGVAMEFAKQNEDTLVIVLADHECSGFSLIGALTKSMAEMNALPSDKDKTQPGIAPDRQKAVGVYEDAGFPKYNILTDGFPAASDIDRKVVVGFGANGDRFEDWMTKPMPIVDSLLSNDIKAKMQKGDVPTGGKYVVAPIDRSPESLRGFFVRGQVPGVQAVHTGTDIPVSVYTKNRDIWLQFVGPQQNIDIFFKLMRAAMGGY
ncbi:MAG: alkaline phosphatase [Chlorobia bacterium]|nr:alkaline phosphatase [Fimbriimonadaceae bacterium]